MMVQSKMGAKWGNQYNTVQELANFPREGWALANLLGSAKKVWAFGAVQMGPRPQQPHPGPYNPCTWVAGTFFFLLNILACWVLPNPAPPQPPLGRVRPVTAATRPRRPLGLEVQPVRGRRTTATPSVPPTPPPRRTPPPSHARQSDGAVPSWPPS